MRLIDKIHEQEIIDNCEASMQAELNRAIWEFKNIRKNVASSPATKEVCELLKQKYAQLCRVYSDKVEWKSSTDNGQVTFYDLGYRNLGNYNVDTGTKLGKIQDEQYRKYVSRGLFFKNDYNEFEEFFGGEDKEQPWKKKIYNETGVKIIDREGFYDGGYYYYPIYSERYLLALEIGQKVLLDYYYDDSSEIRESHKNYHTLVYKSELRTKTQEELKKW